MRFEDTELTPTAYQGSRRADVIYSVRAKTSPVKVYALLHLEGQSTHQAEMALRILEYHTALAAKLVRQKKYKKLPLILTFVLYHGKARWTSKKSIAAPWQVAGVAGAQESAGGGAGNPLISAETTLVGSFLSQINFHI